MVLQDIIPVSPFRLEFLRNLQISGRIENPVIQG